MPARRAILDAQPGTAKTWLLIDLAIEVARGGKWLEKFPVKQGPVLYIDAEPGAPLLRPRFTQLFREKVLGDGDGLEVQIADQQLIHLTNETSLAALRELIEKIRPCLVIMDSLVRFHGADENSASEMAHVSAAVQQIIRDFETSVVFADHVRKLAGTPGALDLSLRGSTEKAAFVDSLLSLRKERGHLVVEHSKSRWAQPAPAFEVAIEDGASAEGKTTVVRWVRTLDDLKDEGFADEDEETVPDHLREIDEWTLRTQIVASLRAEMNPKRIDDALARLVSSKLVERKDEKGPRGGKAAARSSGRELAPRQSSHGHQHAGRPVQAPGRGHAPVTPPQCGENRAGTRSRGSYLGLI